MSTATPAHSERQHPVVVGIGASAGGIPALQEFLRALPADTGAVFVVIVHLDPRLASDLARVLATFTPMKIVQVVDSERLTANTVYVIPPDRHLRLTEREISAAPFDEPRGQRAPIDLFFRSLAKHGDGFAVILTGAGSDGALGVRAVKEAGGIILVQDPAEAEFPSMPRAALSTGMADFVLPVAEIATRLVELISEKQEGMPEISELDEDQLRRILAHVRTRTGHDFSRYKRSTVLRRISRRMQVTRMGDLGGYNAYLRDQPDEVQGLLADLLISVTSFFRDREAFETLKTSALSELFAASDPSDTLRVWVPGCATGEEAYSVAMLLLEEASRRDVRPAIQIFASDMDNRALAIAREGRYPQAIEADVSDERLRRFFIREDNGYRVRQELRDLLLFASHDLLKDPPFSRVDLITCRNLMIYLDRDLQEQVGSTFYYALKPHGFLLVGSAESAESPAGLFRIVDRNARLYRSTADESDRPRLLPRLMGTFGLREQALPLTVPAPSPSTLLTEAVTHRRALERLAPPSILVDEAHRVVHMSDTAGRYMQPSGGPLNSDLIELVRPELRFELRSALHRALEQKLHTLSMPIPVRFNGTARQVLVQVRPLTSEENPEPRQAIVMFIEGDTVDGSLAGDPNRPQDEIVRRLTQELELSQARLRTVREESEASTEELRAANEELQSINEEYRSTSEELETSKEELQSINEELQTVNSELKLKLDDISRAHNDLQNLMAATEVGTLFLDTGLRIKRFTDRITDLFSLTMADKGRPITDFAHKLDYDGLLQDAHTVLADLAPVRREIRGHDDHWYDVRLRPYRTTDDKIDGIVLTFLDISERRKAEAALRDSERSLSQQKRLVDLSRDPIFVWDFDRGIIDWNRGSAELYGYVRDEVIDKDPHDLLQTTVRDSSLERLRNELAANGSWAGELSHKTKDGRTIVVDARFELVEIDGRRLVLETTRDVTERKQSERRQQLLLSELTHRVKNTLAVVQSIAQQTLRSTTSAEGFVASFSGRLAALSSTHGLLVESNWVGADLAELARSQFAPHASDPGQLRLEGPEVLLPADVASPFGLVLHELVTNAAKYGALSQSGGRINLTWNVAAAGNGSVLNVLWQEEGGPPVRGGAPAGFGSTLIERGIPEAEVSREWPPEGFVCRIAVRLQEAANHGGLDQA